MIWFIWFSYLQGFPSASARCFYEVCALDVGARERSANRAEFKVPATLVLRQHSLFLTPWRTC